VLFVTGCIGTIEPEGGFRAASPDAAGPAGPDARPADAAVPDAINADAPHFDCKAPLPPTLDYRLMAGFVPSEDIAFDDAGNVIESDTQNIYKTTFDVVRTTFVPNFHFRAGMRMTPAGDLIVNSDQDGTLVRVDSSGIKHTILSGLSYPNGMEIDQAGNVYVTEQTANKVIRVNPLTGQSTVLSQGPISNPNGISFNETYTALYIDGFSGVGTIYRLAINPDGSPGELTEWATGVGTGLLDGLAVDACGNLYVCDYGNSTTIRIDKTGTMRDIIATHGMYMANMQWGRGFGGWSETKLYFAAVGNGIVEMDVGIPSKPRW
jgi:hypothetical protein